MEATRQLHLEQPYLKSHMARVLEVREAAGYELVLDASAFYPGGGGQPCDVGRIAGIPVVAVYEDAGRPGVVVHVLGPAGTGAGGGAGGGAGDVAGVPKPGDEAPCETDWSRRYGLMQQHTGQHLISALALERFGAPTTGFHLGEETATVDLAFPAVGLAGGAGGGELHAMLDDLERLVSGEVFANRAVRVHSTVAGQVPAGVEAGLELRVRERGPAPKGTERWRVVEIGGLDLSPCGGTHVAATGEVGPVSFERYEKIRDSVRIEFLCGWRALEAGWRRTRDMRRLARELSVHEREAVEAALRGLEDAGTQKKRLAELEAAVISYEADQLVRGAGVLPGGVRLVSGVLPERPAGELKLLVSTIVQHSGHVALLAAGGETMRLVFGRAADVDIDLRRVLACAVAEMGGRGGGTPALVQGGGGDAAAVGRAMTAAAGVVLELVSANASQG